MSSMERRREAAVGAGLLGTLAALAAIVEQGLLWLALFLGGFIVYGIWFWRRVFWRSAASPGIGEQQRLRSTFRRSSKQQLGLNGPKGKDEGRIDHHGRGPAAAEAEALGPSGVRQRKAHRSRRTSTIEDSESSEDALSVSETGRDVDDYRDGGSDHWDEVEFDSADEADSEAEQDCFLPATEQRRQLPRRMSFPSFNLAAGCFPPRANVKHHVVSACLYSASLPSTKAVLHLIEGRLLKFHRFRSVPVVSSLYPRWREVTVQPVAHVRRLRVRDVSELHLCTEWIICQPCDQGRPRWQIWLIENAAVQMLQNYREQAEEWDSKDYRTREEQLGAPSRVGLSGPPRHCIIVRAEHCMGDGISLIELGLRLLTDAHGLPLNELDDPPILKVPATAAEEHLCHLPSPTAHLLRWTRVLLRAPRRVAEALWVAVLLLLGSLRTIAATVANRRDACTPLTGSAADREHVTWCARAQVASAPPVRLNLVRAIKRAGNATLNDVFVAAFTGAVKRYCELQGDSQFSNGGATTLPKVLLACAFFRRTKELPDTSQLMLRNRFTLTSLELPADSKDAKERLNRVKKAPVHFCGCKITELQVLYPNLIPQVEVVSYAGRIFFSIVYDPSIVAEGHRIPSLFVEELYRLADAFGIRRTAHAVEKQEQEGDVKELIDTGASSPIASSDSTKPII